MDSRLNFNNTIFISTMSSAAFTFANIWTYPFDLMNTIIKSNLRDSKTNIIAKLVRKKGISGLFKGITSVVPTNFPSSFSWYFIYEFLNHNTYKNINKQYHNVVPFFNSFIAEIACVTLMIPCDTIQTRIQKGKYKTFTEGMYKLLKNNSILDVYKSTNLLFFQQLVFISSQYTFYENLRKKYLSYKISNRNEVNLSESLFLTIIATFFSNIIVNPINFFVIQYQLSDSFSKKTNFLSMFKEKKRKYGWSIFNRGFNLRFIHLGILSSIYIPSYEYIRQLYGINPSNFN